MPPLTRERPCFAVALPDSTESARSLALDRFLLCALALVGDAAPGPGFPVAVVDVQRRVEILDRLVELVRLDIALAAARIGRRDEGVAVDGGDVEVEDRLPVAASMVASMLTCRS